MKIETRSVPAVTVEAKTEYVLTLSREELCVLEAILGPTCGGQALALIVSQRRHCKTATGREVYEMFDKIAGVI